MPLKLEQTGKIKTWQGASGIKDSIKKWTYNFEKHMLFTKLK